MFSHGGSSDLRYWEPQREAFASRYKFIAYSHRFHGAGPWPATGDYSADGAHDRPGCRHAPTRGGPVHLVGFSTAIALRATLREPSLVRSLTIIEPNVPWLLDGDPEGEAVLAWWRAENDRVRAEAGGDAERRAKLWFELVNNRGPGHVRRPARGSPPDVARQLRRAKRPAAPAPRAVTCERLGAITTPTLVIGAEHGMPYSRRIVDVLASCIPGSRLRSSSPSDALHELPGPRQSSTKPSWISSDSPRCRPVQDRLRRRDVADDRGELPRARPHRPMARRQVDPGRVAELWDAGKECPVRMLLRVGLVLLGGEPSANQGARDVAPRFVGQVVAIAEEAAGDRVRPAGGTSPSAPRSARRGSPPPRFPPRPSASRHP